MTIAPWFLPSMMVMVFWGISMFLPKLALKTLPPLHLVVYSTGFFIAESFLLLAFYGFKLDFDPRGVFFAMSVGVLVTLGQVLYLFAIRHDNRMIHVTVITSMYPAVSTLLAFLILDEKLTLRQMSGIALGLCSIILMVMARDSKTKK